VLSGIGRYLVLVLLLIVPLQGMAAVLHALTCAPHASTTRAAEHAAHEHAPADAAAHDHGAPYKHSHESSGAGDSAQHQCCHHLSAAPPAFTAPRQVHLPVYEASAAVLELTFVLEQPQRPPRA
jgi:hypothetical protein